MDLTKIPISEAELKEQMPTLALNPDFIGKIYDGEYLNLIKMIDMSMNDIALIIQSIKRIPLCLKQIIDSQMKQDKLLDGIIESGNAIEKQLDEILCTSGISEDKPSETRCPDCNGRGNTPTHPICITCGGTGRISKTQVESRRTPTVADKG